MRKINRNKGNVMKITIRNEYGLPVYETSGTFIDKTEKRKGSTYKDISGNMKVRVTDSMGNEIYHSKDKPKRKNNKKYDNNQYKEGNKRKEQQAAKSIKENVKRVEQEKIDREAQASKQAEEFFKKKEEAAKKVHQQTIEQVQTMLDTQDRKEEKPKKKKVRKYTPYAEMKKLQKAKEELNIESTSSNRLPDDVNDIIKSAIGSEPPKPLIDDDNSKYEAMAAEYGYDEDESGRQKIRKTNKGGEY